VNQNDWMTIYTNSSESVVYWLSNHPIPAQ